MSAHLGIVYHVNALIHDILGMLLEEFKNVFHLCLVGEPTKTDTIASLVGGENGLERGEDGDRRRDRKE